MHALAAVRGASARPSEKKSSSLTWRRAPRSGPLSRLLDARRAARETVLQRPPKRADVPSSARLIVSHLGKRNDLSDAILAHRGAQAPKVLDVIVCCCLQADRFHQWKSREMRPWTHVTWSASWHRAVRARRRACRLSGSSCKRRVPWRCLTVWLRRSSPPGHGSPVCASQVSACGVWSSVARIPSASAQPSLFRPRNNLGRRSSWAGCRTEAWRSPGGGGSYGRPLFHSLGARWRAFRESIHFARAALEGQSEGRKTSIRTLGQLNGWGARAAIATSAGLFGYSKDCGLLALSRPWTGKKRRCQSWRMRGLCASSL